MTKALLIKSPDDRYLLSPLPLEPILLAYAKESNHTVWSVETEESIPSIREAAKKIGIPGQMRKTKPKVNTIDTLWEPQDPEPATPNTVITKSNYQEHLERAKKVQEHIKHELTHGKSISLEDVANWAKEQDMDITRGGLCRHLQKCLSWGVEQGFNRIKEGRKYRLEK